MQTITFDPNFSIFDKKFVIPNEYSRSIDMKPIEGDQFWPKQHKSSNKLKKFISKAFKSLKRKVFRKPKEIAVVKEIMVSEITSFSTDEDIMEIDEIYEIIDIYSSFPESFPDKDASNSSNIVEYEASFSPTYTLTENYIIDHIEHDSTQCYPKETKSIACIPYEDAKTSININVPRNISNCELRSLIEKKLAYPLREDHVFVRIDNFYGDSIDKHDERITIIDFLNYLIKIKKSYLIDSNFKFRRSSII
ncbi:14985_t:CDS:1 [Funneliformis geosporum]|uniref:576_t:CDS:1 n=1 Tax=Funneliformis geosporum TaxID=1117311 RepID=A0A9W4WTV9_9GLOM|nr:14985_t:CDS:1 [Funneliformis geosporum]CAI2178585.1 576_t:CDS:1 [Funneliformis geosporum]